MTLVVTFSSIILASAEESRWPTSITPFLAVFTHLFVDKWKKIRLSVVGANTLGLLAFGVMAWEFSGGDVLAKLLSGAHLLVYMTWVVLLLQKGIRQYWWLLALSLLQISVASVLTTSATFGMSLVGMLFLLIWTTSVFTLYRTRRRMERSVDGVEDSLNRNAATSDDDRVTIRNGLQLDSYEPWIGWRFRAIVGFSFVASMLIAAVTFAVFPRIWVNESPLAGIREAAQKAIMNQSGFTENVALGEIGQIMQSDARVMQFEITRMQDGGRVMPEEFADFMRMDEILFRGNALGYYKEGRWSSGSIQGKSVGDLESRRRFSADRKLADFRVKITQDPPINSFAFAPTPILNATSKTDGHTLEQRWFSYSLIHRIRNDRSSNQPAEFEVWCQAAPQSQVRHMARRRVKPTGPFSNVLELIRPANQYVEVENDYANTWCITRGIETSLPKLSKKAIELCSDNGQLVSPRDRINRIFHFLNTSGEFNYSLTLGTIDRSVDPVEDFLFNTKTGHCEYFASACALMLQAVDVPARIVNGYKGSSLNTVSKRHEVKQKQAHAWLEAYVDFEWETLDPTPATRNEITNQTSQLAWLSDLRIAVNDNWNNVVEKMSLERQEAMVRPWLDTLKTWWDIVRQQGFFGLIAMFYREVILQPTKWISFKTGFATFFVLLVIGLIAKSQAMAKFRARFATAFGWMNSSNRRQRSVVRFYESFRALCERHGLSLPQNQTARENAAMATSYFSDYLTDPVDRLLPERIASAFNSVRFGARELSPEVVESIRSDVGKLSSLLKRQSTKTDAADIVTA